MDYSPGEYSGRRTGIITGERISPDDDSFSIGGTDQEYPDPIQSPGVHRSPSFFPLTFDHQEYITYPVVGKSRPVTERIEKSFCEGVPVLTPGSMGYGEYLPVYREGG
jgi:hypothetical protein